MVIFQRNTVICHRSLIIWQGSGLYARGAWLCAGVGQLYFLDKCVYMTQWFLCPLCLSGSPSKAWSLLVLYLSTNLHIGHRLYQLLLGHIHNNYKQTSNSFHLYNGKLIIYKDICTCLQTRKKCSMFLWSRNGSSKCSSILLK